jgi:hypothetical protein
MHRWPLIRHLRYLYWYWRWHRDDPTNPYPYAGHHSEDAQALQHIWDGTR